MRMGVRDNKAIMSVSVQKIGIPKSIGQGISRKERSGKGGAGRVQQLEVPL